MDCTICEKGIKNNHLCSSCLKQLFIKKQERILELKNRISSNSFIITKKLETKKEKLEIEKKYRQEEYSILDLQEQKKTLEEKNETLKKIVENLKKNIKIEDEKIKSYEKEYQEYLNSKHLQFLKKQEKNFEIHSNAKRSMVNQLNESKKQKVKEIMELFPIFKKGKYLCVFSDSIKIELNYQKLEFNQILNYSLYYLSLILNLFSLHLNIEIPHEIFFTGTIPHVQFDSKSYSLYLKEEHFQNKEQIEKFRYSLQLFNEDVLSVCHNQGIVILEKNKDNFPINFLSLYNYEYLGSTGPYAYYTSSNSIENAQDNYYISKDLIKFIQIEEKEKLNSSQKKNPKGYWIDMDENHFGSSTFEKKEKVEDSDDIEEIE